MTDLSPSDLAKDAAARAGVALVQDGMRLGLGTGSTAVFMVHRLAERIRAEGLRLRCAATSRATCDLAGQLGIRIEELDEIGWLDLTLDGADEIDPDLNLIKGGGGAHLREKITAAASERMVVIADPTKVVETLGAHAAGKLVYFMSIEGAKFRRPVVPGDQLRIHVVKDRRRGNVWKFTAFARVEGVLVAEATYAAMIMERAG